MTFQVCNTKKGYIVEANIGGHKWHPMRNFGENQGDAIFFMDSVCPRMETKFVEYEIRQYKEDEIWETRCGRFRIRRD